MLYPELIEDQESFARLRAECALIFDIDQRLPGRVFRRQFTYYYAFEYRQILGNRFAHFMAGLADNVGDRTVNYMTLEPDPETYYHKHYAFYGVASFDTRTLGERYLEVMNRGGAADSFLARGGDVAVLWGESLDWGIFCDRISWELGVMGSMTKLVGSAAREVGCMDASMLSSYILQLYHWKPEVGETFISGLKQTFPTLL
jgi:hypothetical protein